ncbi:MAG: hypothetical protein AAGN46_07760 [Acidobacteriota bacterium]
MDVENGSGEKRSGEQSSGEEQATAQPAATRSPPFRRTLVAICTCLAVAALAQAVRRDALQESLERELETSGVVERQEGVVERVEREIVGDHARLLVARSLVYDLLTREDLDAGEVSRQAAAEHLGAARRLAADTLGRQPTSWEAAMLLGTATYLEGSLTQDRRLYSEARRWEAPLEVAVREGRGHPEPRRLLATAYLETWTALSPAKREIAKELLTQVFRDDVRAFEALLPAWLSVVRDRDEALSVVPERPEAWAALEELFAERRAWRAFVDARERSLAARTTWLEGLYAEGVARLQLGDYTKSRSILLRVVLAAPPSRRFQPLVERALDTYAPGLHGLASADALRRWVDWALDLERFDLPTLAPRAMDHLLDALGESDAPIVARSALIADDIQRAERAERQTETLQVELWAPYLIEKARWATRGGNPQAALSLLGQVARRERRSIPYSLELERAAAATGDLTARARADEILTEHRSTEWPASAWRLERDRAVLEMLPAAPGRALVIELAEAPDEGGVAEIWWDGGLLERRVVAAGGVVRLPIEIESRPHRLEVRSVAGGTSRPGSVRILPQS